MEAEPKIIVRMYDNYSWEDNIFISGCSYQMYAFLGSQLIAGGKAYRTA